MCLQIDGTRDIQGNKLINVIASTFPKNEMFLIESKYIENENSQTLIDTLNTIVVKYSKKWSIIDSIITDNGRKNTKAINSIQQALNKNLLHMRCVAHFLHILSTQIIKNSFFSYANKLCANLYSLFSHSIEKKHAYLKFLKVNNYQVNLMPKPSLTRWGTWFKTLNYLYEYLEPIMKFIKSQNEKNKSGNLENQFIDLFSDLNSFINLVISLSFIKDHSFILENNIELFQTNEKIIFIAYQKIMEIKEYFTSIKNVKNYEDLGTHILQSIRTLNVIEDWEFLQEIIVEMSEQVIEKITEFEEYDSFQFLKVIQIFDPKLKNQYETLDLQKHNYFKSKITNKISQELKLYMNTQDNLSIDFDKYWSLMKVNLPNLTQLVQRIKSMPISICETERSFSFYKILKNPLRNRLSEEKIKIFQILRYLNSN